MKPSPSSEQPSHHLHLLFSSPSSWTLTLPPARKSVARPSGGEVPRTIEGLRILASEGSWSEVLDLANQLEKEIRGGLNTSSSPLKPGSTTSTASSSSSSSSVDQYDSAVLQLILTKVTAYTKMNDFGRAVQLIENLPWDALMLPNTPASKSVPFSLIFLRVYLPMMMIPTNLGQVANSQASLYSMLGKITNQLETAVRIQHAQNEMLNRKSKNKNKKMNNNDSSSDSDSSPLGSSSSSSSDNDDNNDNNHNSEKSKESVSAFIAGSVSGSYSSNRNKNKNKNNNNKDDEDYDDEVPISLLEHRRFRVARAIFVSHMKLSEIIGAIDILQSLAKFHSDRRERLMSEDTKAGNQIFDNILISSPAVSRVSVTSFFSSPKNSMTNFNSSSYASSARLQEGKNKSSSSTSSSSSNSEDEEDSTTPAKKIGGGDESNIFSSPGSNYLASNNSSTNFPRREDREVQKLADMSLMDQLCCLQQALCLALFSGNAPLAHQLRKQIESISVTPISKNNKTMSNNNINSVSKEPKHLKDLMQTLNDSLLDVFFDRPADAAGRLCFVVGNFLINHQQQGEEGQESKKSVSNNSALLVPLPVLGNPFKYEKSLSHIQTSFSPACPSSSSSFAAGEEYNLITQQLPFYLQPQRSLHVQYQFLSICLSLIALIPQALHAPPTPTSQRAPASVESKRPQKAPDTSALCNLALDRISTCYPAIALRMPGLLSLSAEVRHTMTTEQNGTRKQILQAVLGHLVAGREGTSNLV